VHQPGVRRNQRGQIAVHRNGRCGGREMAVDRGSQRARLSRIPRSCDRRGSDVHEAQPLALSLQPFALREAMLAFGMPAAFTREQIAAIAALAHLELDASETDLFARQLGEILAYAEVVQQIDTTGIPPTTSV